MSSTFSGSSKRSSSPLGLFKPSDFLLDGKDDPKNPNQNSTNKGVLSSGSYVSQEQQSVEATTTNKTKTTPSPSSKSISRAQTFSSFDRVEKSRRMKTAAKSTSSKDTNDLNAMSPLENGNKNLSTQNSSTDRRSNKLNKSPAISFDLCAQPEPAPVCDTVKPKVTTPVVKAESGQQITTATSPMTAPNVVAEKKVGGKMSKPAIGLFWDIENCRIPALKSAISYINAIRDKFCKDYFCDEFICVCAVDSLSDRLCEELNNAQVTLAHVPSGAKNAADEKLRQKLRRFGEIFAHQNAAAILITGDINFISDITDVRHRYGVHVILIHNDHTNDQLKAMANVTYLHEDILDQTPNRSAKPGMQYCPQELCVRNLPLHASEQAIKNRLGHLCDNCGGRVYFVNRSKGFALVSFSSSEMCERAYIRLQNKEVFGNKIEIDIALKPSENMNNSQQQQQITNYNNNNAYGYSSPQMTANVNNYSSPNYNYFQKVHSTFPKGSNQSPSKFQGHNRSMNQNQNQNQYQPSPITSIKTTVAQVPKHLLPPLPASKNIIKDSDVTALLISTSPEMDCYTNQDRVRKLFSKYFKAKKISYKTSFSKNCKNKIVVCFKDEAHLKTAKLIVPQLKDALTKDISFMARSFSFENVLLDDLRIHVEALLDTNQTQLHTFFLQYWQQYNTFLKPSLLNYLIDDLIEVEEDDLSGMKLINKLPCELQTFEYIKESNAKKSLSSPDSTEGEFNPYNPSSFTLLDISDSPSTPLKQQPPPFKPLANAATTSNTPSNRPFTQNKLSTVSIKETESQEELSDYSDYILFHNYDPLPFHRCPKPTSRLSIKSPENFSIENFSGQVYQLISNHGGFIPMSEFLNCYQYMFGTLITESKIPFEQLLLSVDGVSTFCENKKCVCFSSLDTGYRENFSDVRAPLPVMQNKLKDFTTEVLRQLEMAESNHFKVPICEFLKNYKDTKQREFSSSRYGFEDPKDLFSACRGFFTVLGVGINQTICYSRRMNIIRFGSFLAKKFKSTQINIIKSHKKLQVDPVNFGHCTLSDLIETNWLRLALSTQRSQPTSFDLSSPCVRDVTSFTIKVFVILYQSTNQMVSYDQFLTLFQSEFGCLVNANEFGFTDLKELLLATELVWVSDDSSESSPSPGSMAEQKKIMFRPVMAVMFEIVSLLIKNNGSLSMNELEPKYKELYKKNLNCYKHGFPNVPKMIQSLSQFLIIKTDATKLNCFGDFGDYNNLYLTTDLHEALYKHGAAVNKSSLNNNSKERQRRSVLNAVMLQQDTVSSISQSEDFPPLERQKPCNGDAFSSVSLPPSSYTQNAPSFRGKNSSKRKTQKPTTSSTSSNTPQGLSSNSNQIGRDSKRKPGDNYNSNSLNTPSAYSNSGYSISGKNASDVDLWNPSDLALEGPQMPSSGSAPMGIPLPPPHFFERK